MVGVLIVDEFLTTVGGQVGIGRRDREGTKRIDPTDADFDAEMVCRCDLFRSAAAADRGPDPLAVVVAKGERRPAGRAELALPEGRAEKTCRGFPRQGEMFEPDCGERAKRSADGLLTHPVMAETGGSRKNGRLVADRTIPAAAPEWWGLLGGDNGTSRRPIPDPAAAG